MWTISFFINTISVHKKKSSADWKFPDGRIIVTLIMIKVLKKALETAEYIARANGRPVPPMEIETELGLSHATAVRILKELTGLGYLEQTGARKGYLPGPMAFELGGGRRYREDFVKFAAPLLEETARELKESVLFCRLHQSWRYILIQYNFNPAFHLLDHAARLNDLYWTGSGRLLLAHASQTELKQVLGAHGLPEERHWPEASKSLNDFRRELEKIRTKGLVEMQRSHCGNFHLIALPVFERDRFLGVLAANWEYGADEEKSRLCRKALLRLAKRLNEGEKPEFPVSLG